MSFVSTEFIFFFVVIFMAFFRLRQHWRWMFLLASSYVFYAFWQPAYVLLIVFSTVVDFCVALALERTSTTLQMRRRLLLACSLLVNLGLLFVFKYANFFWNTAADLGGVLSIPFERGALDLLLPVGISFYTFQSMAYTWDVYRGEVRAEKHLGIFAAYIAFFPQLVAGPIERARNMLPQFRRRFEFDYDRVVSGSRLVVWGVFKKLVVADRLAIYVNAVYADVHTYSGLPLLLATFFFGLQIYFDFSAYSEIAIGVARILGFRLSQNFRQPYMATSLRGFWRRWHISLSTWFRDYVYVSLGGNRKGLRRQILNLLFVFAVSGLWHGANWTFVLWGIFHGAIVAFETVISGQSRARQTASLLSRGMGLIYVLVIVNVGWIFFRAENVADIVYVLQNMFDLSQGFAALTDPFGEGVLPQRLELVVSVICIAAVLFVDALEETMGAANAFARLNTFWRWTLYYIAIIMIYISLFYSATTQEFYYFQF